MIAILDYNAGNTRSVYNALKRLGKYAMVTADPAQLRAASHVIFPGVGEASSAMKYLEEHRLDTLLRELTQPVLGICLGMQLLCTHTEERDTKCLGIIDAQVRKFAPGLKVPHMGWNDLTSVKGELVSDTEGQDFYFVHSYYVDLCDATSGICEYGVKFTATLQQDNFYGVQFHTEKSGPAGLDLLKKFTEL